MTTTQDLLRKALEPCSHCQYRDECKSEGACRRESALAQAGGTSEFTPRHGDKLRGIWASEKNPQRDGYYVETTRHKTSRIHSARYYRCTDGKGQFWEYPPESVVLLERAAIRTALSSPADQPGCVRAAEAVQPTAEEMAEKYVSDMIARAPDGIRKLGDYLSRILDEDDFKTAERYVLGAMEAAPLFWRDVLTATLPPVGSHLLLLVRWEDGEGISMGEVRDSQYGPYIDDWMADKGGPVGFILTNELLRIPGEGNAKPAATVQPSLVLAAPLPQGDGADAKDAARYRCLRKGNDYEHDAPMALLYEKESDTGERPFWSLAGEALDDAVDAAMRASSATEEGTTK